MRMAKLDENSIVLEVVNIDSQEWLDANLDGEWVETFKDGTRYNYAGPGYSYDETRDAFIPPKPYQSWVLVEETCTWSAPVPMPEDGQDYNWDEDVIDWVAVVE